MVLPKGIRLWIKGVASQGRMKCILPRKNDRQVFLQHASSWRDTTSCTTVPPNATLQQEAPARNAWNTDSIRKAALILHSRSSLPFLRPMQMAPFLHRMRWHSSKRERQLTWFIFQSQTSSLFSPTEDVAATLAPRLSCSLMGKCMRDNRILKWSWLNQVSWKTLLGEGVLFTTKKRQEKTRLQTMKEKHSLHKEAGWYGKFQALSFYNKDTESIGTMFCQQQLRGTFVESGIWFSSFHLPGILQTRGKHLVSNFFLIHFLNIPPSKIKGHKHFLVSESKQLNRAASIMNAVAVSAGYYLGLPAGQDFIGLLPKTRFCEVTSSGVWKAKSLVLDSAMTCQILLGSAPVQTSTVSDPPNGIFDFGPPCPASPSSAWKEW